ncbi:DUF5688 family protein [Lachnospiraceae bacterium 54-53]
MVYEAFLETVKSSLRERLGDGFTLTVQSVRKNNGLTLDGLCIGKKNEKAAPTIYLNSFYEAFRNGKPLPGILADIMALYQNSRLPDDFHFDELLSTDQIRDKIIYRLINETANRELLEDVPHFSYPDLDLCLVFCLSFLKSEDNLLTALIHSQHLKTWNLSTEELYTAAMTNTPRLFPARIRSLPEVIKDIAGKSADKELAEEAFHEFFDQVPLSPPMYVLTNSTGMNGAGCMFYEGILKDFAACIGSDLIILPSSIHEVLILPYSREISFEELADTVFSINQEEVPEEDRLSNHIYFYSRERNGLYIAFTSSVPIGTENP